MPNLMLKVFSVCFNFFFNSSIDLYIRIKTECVCNNASMSFVFILLSNWNVDFSP